MQIILNDEQVEIQNKITLVTFLENTGYSNSKIAVAINANFIPRNQYQEIILNEHDVIDIIVPMQGG